MPIYMDLHKIPGITPRQVAEAHYKDVLIQNKYACRCMTYWIDEDQGSVFCLIDAPDKEAVVRMHSHAHGLVPHEIVEVRASVVEAFLGRIKDPESTMDQANSDLKIFSDPAFRAILVAKTTDTRLLRHILGRDRADKLLLTYSATVKDQLNSFGGREVECHGEGFIASFTSVSKAIACSQNIIKSHPHLSDEIGLHMGLHAGMPIAKNDTLFGSIVRLARYLSSITKSGEVLVSSAIRQHIKEYSLPPDLQMRWLNHAEEAFLISVMDTLASCWNDPHFGIGEFCRKVLMSKPQLYRKTKSLTGKSPNTLLREYRLLQSLDLLKKENRNIAQTTFDVGFTSPSYFAKCFHRKFGLHPLTYLKGK